MKKFILSFVLLALCCNAVFAMPKPTAEFYANDYASVLSEETKNYIISNGNALYESTRAQIVVVTLPTIDGQNERDYAIELARQWEIGGKEENNGVLILLALQERAISVEVGYGLEGALPDSKVGRFIDGAAFDYLSAGDYDTGLKNLYSVILDETYKEYGIETPDSVQSIPVREESTRVNEDVIELVVWLVIIILYIILRSKGGGRRGGGFFIFPTGRGGGFGGGSGGGFRGSSGGGGSFGGGGASRRF